MSYLESLIEEAESYWINRDRLPTDLFAKLIAEGVDVVQLEQDYLKKMEYEIDGE